MKTWYIHTFRLKPVGEMSCSRPFGTSPVDFHSTTKSSKNVSATNSSIWPLPIFMMFWCDFILLIAFPLTPFFWNGSTSAGKLKLLRITVMSWMETSFRGTNEAASAGDSVLGTESPSGYEIERINCIINLFIQFIHTQQSLITSMHTDKHAYIQCTVRYTQTLSVAGCCGTEGGGAGAAGAYWIEKDKIISYFKRIMRFL